MAACVCVRTCVYVCVRFCCCGGVCVCVCVSIQYIHVCVCGACFSVYKKVSVCVHNAKAGDPAPYGSTGYVVDHDCFVYKPHSCSVDNRL